MHFVIHILIYLITFKYELCNIEIYDDVKSSILGIISAFHVKYFNKFKSYSKNNFVTVFGILHYRDLEFFCKMLGAIRASVSETCFVDK